MKNTKTNAARLLDKAKISYGVSDEGEEREGDIQKVDLENAKNK